MGAALVLVLAPPASDRWREIHAGRLQRRLGAHVVSFADCLDAWRTPSKTKKRTDSSIPTCPSATPRSFRVPAIRWYGLSSSCHTRICNYLRRGVRSRPFFWRVDYFAGTATGSASVGGSVDFQ